jgi:peptidyl-prolyl cis-trans isomerase B (cyclophilin B)
MKAYVDACPGQSMAHITYLRTLLKLDRLADAQRHFESVMNSPLVKGSAAANANIRLLYAANLSVYGYVTEAAADLEKLAGNEFVAANPSLAKMFADSQADMKPLKEQWNAELKFRAEDAEKKNPRLTLETNKGKIVIELFEDDAPNTVASMVALVQAKFYDGLTFHRFVEDFVIQGGCPEGTGGGDPGYRLKSEVSKRNHFRGMVGMACSGPKTDTEGSQFYICLSNEQNVRSLSGKYVIVGRVIEGLDVSDRLRIGDKMKTVTVTNLRDHEYKPEKITK